MQKKLINSLINLGLSPKEAEIYLIALELGPSSILEISKATSINRSTIYTIIDSLLKKALISIEVLGFKKLYVAEDPKRLESIFEQKKKDLLDSLPIFKEIYQTESRHSFIKYCEGLESIKRLYEELLEEIKSGDDYLVIGNQASWFSKDPSFFEKFIRKRSKLNIKIRLLLQDSATAQKHKKFEKNLNQKIRILPKDTHLSTNMVILPKKIIIHQLEGLPLAVVIESRSIVQMNRELFEIIWASLAVQ